MYNCYYYFFCYLLFAITVLRKKAAEIMGHWLIVISKKKKKEKKMGHWLKVNQKKKKKRIDLQSRFCYIVVHKEIDVSSNLVRLHENTYSFVVAGLVR